MRGLSMTRFGTKLADLKVLSAFERRASRMNEAPHAGPSLPAEASNSTRTDKARFRSRNRVGFGIASRCNTSPGRPCLICGRQPSDPHHLRFAQPPALGRKVSDEFTVPLCRGHHREVHRSSDEIAWWTQAGIDALAAALKLWRETHPVRAVPASEVTPETTALGSSSNSVQAPF